MSEFRQNITTGEWVIIATERNKRPDDYARNALSGQRPPAHETHRADCPFCAGNEHRCLAPVWEERAEESWLLRVVPNIFAAVSPQDSPRRERAGLHLKTSGYGRAEVVIETPVHNADLAFMSVEQVERILRAYQARYEAHARDPHIRMVHIFRNYGGSAGASLKHPHSQIISTAVAPPHITDQIDYARRAYNSWGNCVYCAMIEEETTRDERVIALGEHFVAICPFASKTPYEVRIYPKRHSAVFGDIRAEETADLARVLRDVLARLSLWLKDPDYNYYIRSATTAERDVPFYHWYLTILPKTSHHAGFELGTGIYINTTNPEQCARELRAVFREHPECSAR